MVLKLGMNTSDVSEKWKRPWANVNNVTAVDPPGVSASYRFPPGDTYVRWVAVNAIGEQASCVVRVNVDGKYINCTSARWMWGDNLRDAVIGTFTLIFWMKNGEIGIE